MKNHEEHKNNHSCCDNGKEKDLKIATVDSEDIIYVCPMHPEVRREKPGICPECGMNLLPEKRKDTAHGHHDDLDKHKGHRVSDFAKKFWVSLILTIPVLIYSDLIQNVIGWKAPEFLGSRYLPLVLGSVVFFYGGWVFIASARRELKARLPGMMTLIAMAIFAAYSYSIYSVLTGKNHDLFWELTTLITIMLLGHWVEMRAVSGAQGALKELAKLLPDKAEIIKGDKTEIIPLEDLKEEDIVFVRPGGKIPADGTVTEGRSDVDESMISGESKPVLKNTGSEVIAGTINGDGSLKIKVTKIGEHTFLAGVMRLVNEAQASKSRLQMLSDRAAFYLTIVAIGSGILTFVLWLAFGSQFSFAIERLVAVLVIACPHALGLAIPLVASISTTMAARNGFLIKQRLSLEMARKVDVVLFDKTGTLTKGQYGVEKVVSFSKSRTEDEVLQLAASVDSHSEHFVAKAIVSSAKAKNLKLIEIKDFERLPGKGVRAKTGNKIISVGGEAILKEVRIKLAAEYENIIAELGKKGETVIFVIEDNELAGIIALADLIREESREAVDNLKKVGIKVAMITGDSEDVAKWVADDLKIDEYFAKVLPHEKSDKVKFLQAKGAIVAMVGDGINDAPALTQADLGIAIGAGTNVAIESAGIILMKNDPRDIAKVINLSKMTYSKMIQNLFWATGYNIIALPLAAGALAFKGILLQPAVAAILMSFSTVIVAFNAMMLRRNKL